MKRFFLAAARWARRCAKRRVAWPWRRRQSLFSVSYCVGKTLKSVNVCLECPVFNALGAAVCHPQSLVWTLGRAVRRKACRLALAEAPMQIFCVVSCWQNVKICECFLKMRSFHCIGGGSVPPPPNCRTLGWAARRKAHCLALAEA